jgi:hypothetical protein
MSSCSSKRNERIASAFEEIEQLLESTTRRAMNLSPVEHGTPTSSDVKLCASQTISKLLCRAQGIGQRIHAMTSHASPSGLFTAVLREPLCRFGYFAAQVSP